jgi:hypothetical protein
MRIQVVASAVAADALDDPAAAPGGTAAAWPAGAARAHLLGPRPFHGTPGGRPRSSKPCLRLVTEEPRHRPEGAHRDSW